MKRIAILGVVVLVLLSGCSSSIVELDNDETATEEPTAIVQESTPENTTTIVQTNLAETTQTTTESQSGTTNLTQIQTVTETVTETVTPTVTETATETSTSTSTQTPTPTETSTPTSTETPTPTKTPTSTPSPTPTETPTKTPTEEPTETTYYTFGKTIVVKSVNGGESNYRLFVDGEVGRLSKADNESEAINPDVISYSSEINKDVVNGFVGSGGIDDYTTEGVYKGIENQGTTTLKVYIGSTLVDTVEPGEDSIDFSND